MEFKQLAVNGPVVMTPKVWGDSRGYFMETFRQNEFDEHCGNFTFVQDNQSSSVQHVLRGLHYQLRRPQGKLVRVIRGKVFDVAVDLRRFSPDFGKCFSAILSDENHDILWVPPGFAHGFFVMSHEAEFVYKCTDYYQPDDEHCLIWNDPQVAVPWPLENVKPQLSPKDEKGLPFERCETYG